MNKVAAIKKLNETELELGLAGTRGSWHQKYINCDTAYVGGLVESITEQALLRILEQYGTVLHVNLIRDAETQKPKGFAFVKYADARSVILAVDNLNGVEVEGRTLRLDHAEDYRVREDNGVDTTPVGLNQDKGHYALNSQDIHGSSIATHNRDKEREAAILQRLERMRKGVSAAKSDVPHRSVIERTGFPHVLPDHAKADEANGEEHPARTSLNMESRSERKRRKMAKEIRRAERAKRREERVQRRAARGNEK